MFASQVNGVTVIFNIAVFEPEVHDIKTLVLKIRQKKMLLWGKQLQIRRQIFPTRGENVTPHTERWKR